MAFASSRNGHADTPRSRRSVAQRANTTPCKDPEYPRSKFHAVERTQGYPAANPQLSVKSRPLATRPDKLAAAPRLLPARQSSRDAARIATNGLGRSSGDTMVAQRSKRLEEAFDRRKARASNIPTELLGSQSNTPRKYVSEGGQAQDVDEGCPSPASSSRDVRAEASKPRRNSERLQPGQGPPVSAVKTGRAASGYSSMGSREGSRPMRNARANATGTDSTPRQSLGRGRSSQNNTDKDTPSGVKVGAASQRLPPRFGSSTVREGAPWQQPGQAKQSDLRRFTEAQRTGFARALREIRAGHKSSCWMWFVIPTPPYVVNGIEKGSCNNRKFALRGEKEATAYLAFEADGVNLRSNYLEIMRAVRDQLTSGTKAITLMGSMDEPKLRSSVKFFERILRDLGDEELLEVLWEMMELLRVEPAR